MCAMGRCQPTEAERRARASARRTRSTFFVGALTLLTAVLGAMLDPDARLTGFLFGALAGAGIGIALLAFPRGDRDYPPDIWDKTLD
jgi:hypothetical protein